MEYQQPTSQQYHSHTGNVEMLVWFICYDMYFNYLLRELMYLKVITIT